MEQNKNQPIEVQANFEVPVEKLYAAWTEPNQLKQWWKTTGHQLSDVTNELKQGGKVEYKFENNELQINGEYEEVQENKMLVYTWNWNFEKQPNANGNYRLRVSFSSSGNGSSLSIAQENLKSDEHVFPHEVGWNKGLEELKKYLNNGNNNSDTSTSTVDSANETTAPAGNTNGYREDPEQVKVGGE